jgi:hypothetical protein
VIPPTIGYGTSLGHWPSYPANEVTMVPLDTNLGGTNGT